MERNPNYWNKDLPYLDGIEVYHLLPFSPELGAAVLSGRVDYARALDPVTARKAAATPGLSTAKFYQSVIHAAWLNAKRKPFDDPRVRRAMHLLFEKQVLGKRSASEGGFISWCEVPIKPMFESRVLNRRDYLSEFC